MENKLKHEPKQTRSQKMKQKIIETSISLFCKAGYANVTTNQIAKTAGISIGSLYFHFHDKEEILYEILDIYNARFLENVDLFENKYSGNEITKENCQKWLTKLISHLIKIHKQTKDFNYELKSIYYLNRKVAQIMDEHENYIYLMILKSLQSFSDILSVKDFEATAMLIQDMISSSVDRIVFKKSKITQKRIAENTIQSILLLLFA